MSTNMMFLLALLLSITVLSFEVSVKGQIKKLDHLIKDLEHEVDELSQLKDEAPKVLKKRMYRDQNSIMYINDRENTDDAIRRYCKTHNCVEQGGDEILSIPQKEIEDKDNEIAENNRLTGAHDPIAPVSAHWKKKAGSKRVIVPYNMTSAIRENSDKVDAIMKAIKRYSENSCIDWVPVEETDETYHVEFINGQGCWSYIGNAESFMDDNKQPISIGDGCQQVGVVIHEMLHCMGFFHEQSRPDRDDYVEIFLENLTDQKFADNFKKQSAALIDSHGIDYDINSVMHYGPDYFAKPGKSTILKRVPNGPSETFVANRIDFTESDLKQLNSMYGCEPNPVVTEAPTTKPPTEPPVTEAPTTKQPTEPPVTEAPTTKPPTKPPVTEAPTAKPPTEPPVTEAPPPEKECSMLAILGLCKYEKVCSLCAAQCEELPSSVRGVVNINIQPTDRCKSWVDKGYCDVGNQYFTWMQAYCLKECLDKSHPSDGGCGPSVNNAF